jgi:hypothetical protein
VLVKRGNDFTDEQLERTSAALPLLTQGGGLHPRSSRGIVETLRHEEPITRVCRLPLALFFDPATGGKTWYSETSVDFERPEGRAHDVQSASGLLKFVGDVTSERQ